MIDLTLVDMDDLIKEVLNRTEVCVIGYTKIEDSGPPIVNVNWHCEKGWLQGLGLCDTIKASIIDRNWLEEE